MFWTNVIKGRWGQDFSSVERAIQQLFPNRQTKFQWQGKPLPTARRTAKGRVSVAGVGQFLVFVPLTEVARFYAARSLRMEKELANRGLSKEVASPSLLAASLEKEPFFMLYEYLKEKPSNVFDNLAAAVELLIVKDKATLQVQLRSESTVKTIKEGFIDCWQYHADRIPDCNVLGSLALEEIKTCLEHGDYTLNNFLFADNRLFVLDWEFFKTDQPLMFDFFDLCRSALKKVDDLLTTIQQDQRYNRLLQKYCQALELSEEEVDRYFEYFLAKFRLIETINQQVDAEYV